MEPTPTLLSEQDYENGFKEIEIAHRSGKRETIRLTAPSYRDAQQLTILLQSTKNPFCITAATLPQEKRDERFLDRLTPQSAALVENTAFGLTFGEEVLKKMIEQTEIFLAGMMGKPGEELKPQSSAPVIPSTT